MTIQEVKSINQRVFESINTMVLVSSALENELTPCSFFFPGESKTTSCV